MATRPWSAAAWAFVSTSVEVAVLETVVLTVRGPGTRADRAAGVVFANDWAIDEYCMIASDFFTDEGAEVVNSGSKVFYSVALGSLSCLMANSAAGPSW